MKTHLVKLLTQPESAWVQIRCEEQRKPRQYLPHLLLWALAPALCLFIGVTQVGWSLVDAERVRLSLASAMQLALLLYLTALLGTVLMGGFIRWMSRSFEARPTLDQCIGFAAYTATPYFIAGITGLYPSRWLAVAALLAASVHASYLLLVGLPKFMYLNQERGRLYAASVWGVGLLVLVTSLVSMILLWFNVLAPQYLRPVAVL
ncbi:DUF1282 family protein [Pseudomonas sp. MPFS]|uniref:Yip1 family protein n=1 Tax=Pseudomonas sp. MPFS TaxID=2795724 RepID=UPI001F129988|nr:Yip1 family protein [Pseudomonas sp. MPFS]UMZ14964.1 DUF1282 family protein [Pseudomonas sp. MPFS]